MNRAAQFLFSIFVLVSLFSITACEKSQKPKDGPVVDFAEDVKPILQTHCVRCHNDENLFGDLNLMNRAAAMRGGKTGPAIVAGKPEESPLYQATNPEHGKSTKAMPATGPSLSESERETVKRWIEQGGGWPSGEEGVVRPVKANTDQV